MYYVYWQEENKIEFQLEGELTRDEFLQIIHQLESLAAMYQNLQVLFDAANVEKFEFKLLLDEYDFYKKYRGHLKRVAVVSDNRFQKFIFRQFNKFSDTEIRSYGTDQIEEARKWIFPSRLP